MPPTTNNIKAIREQAGLSRREIAERTGIDYSNIQKIENGTIDPRESTIRKIADAMGVSPGVFYFEEPREQVSFGGRMIPVLDASNVALWLDGALDGKTLGKIKKIAADPNISIDAFAYLIEATSMEPEFKEGEHVLLSARIEPWPECYVLARIGGKAYFRKFAVKGYNEGEPEFDLIPLNEYYPVLGPKDGAEIIGTMIEHRKYAKRPKEGNG